MFTPIRTHHALPTALRGARSSWAVALLAVSLGACGPSYPESEYPSAPPAGVSASPDDYAPAPPGALWRRDVNEVLDGGLGKFLQRADLRPQVHEGAFVGFRVLELRPPAWWQGVDLVPGDVITRVNGMPIEQPTDAHAAFESLRSSDKLVVSYLREGEPHELSYSIIEKPAPAAKPK
ncbi:MAG TPA: serine protease [Polyangiaceae bacterium]|nr:serine protease [Polyangiaceae bacterium]